MTGGRIAPRLAMVVVVGLVWGIVLAGTAHAQDDPAALNAEVDRLYQAGKYPEATEIAKRSLAINEKSLGPDHPDVSSSLNDLGLLYHKQGRYAEAEPLFKRSLAIREKALGPEHIDVGASLNNLARLHREQGRFTEAAPLHERALAIAEKAWGPEHPGVAIALSNLAEVYRHQGRYDQAEPLYKRSLAISEKALGPQHVAVALALNNLGLVYLSLGRYTEAEQHLKRSVAIIEMAYGPDHPDVGQSLDNLANLYHIQGRYADAEPLYKRGLAILEKALGPEHPNLATSLNNLGGLHHELGHLGEAEPLYKRSLAISEKALGPDHIDVGTALNNLADLYRDQGHDDQSEQLFKRSLAISEKALGLDHPRIAVVLSSLALLYQSQGRYSEAAPLYTRSLAIREKAFRPDHPEVGKAVNSSAALLVALGYFKEAEPALERSLIILEKSLGSEHYMVGFALGDLASVYERQGRYADAERLYLRSFAILKKTFGPDHYLVAVLFRKLAGLYHVQGRYNLAEPFYKRSLQLQEKQLGPAHPATARLLSNLGELAFAEGDWAEAAAYWRRSSDIIQRRSGRSLAEGKLKDGARGEVRRNEIYFWALIKADTRIAVQNHTAGASLPELFEATQWAQGSEAAASIAQMAARSARGSSELAGLVRERQDLVSEWQARDKALIAAKSAEPAKRKAEVENALASRLIAIDARLTEIDYQFARDFPDYAALASPSPVSLSEVQAQLGDDEALVLFLDTPELKPVPEETFVWVVTKLGVRWVRSDFGTAALGREVAALRCGLDATAWHGDGAGKCATVLGPPSDKGRGPKQSLPFDHARAHKLYSALFGEVEDLIKGKHLLIVPSGPLTQLPFQVLVTKPPTSDEHRTIAWLARDHAITILPAVSSLKALRRIGKPSTAPKPMIGFGNPLLKGPDASHAERAALASDNKRCTEGRLQRMADRVGGRGGVASVETRGGLADVSYIKSQAPLPETAGELCAVARDLGVADDDIRLGGRATEREIKSLSTSGDLAAYRIVHFATHGALAGELKAGAEPGLILTPPDEATAEDDGYLSASEIAGLKLNADWVILSACNTAASGTDSAEALSGMARAFFYAGARTLLVSHWAVNSESTVKLIKGMVNKKSADKSLGRAEALRRSMLALIDKGEPHEAHPAYWAPFVVVGEGGIEAGLTTAPTTVTNMKKVPTAAKNQKPAPRPQEDWRVEILR